MIEILMALTVLLPVSGAVSVFFLKRVSTLVIFSLAALPSLLLLMSIPTGTPVTVHYSWLLLGSTFGLDGISRDFLLFTAVLWAVSGVYAHYYLSAGHEKRRFYFFFLLAMTGNIGLVLSLDIVSFYFLFTLMSFASYGLINHDRSDFSRYASLVYIIMAILGEIALLTAFMLAFKATGSIQIADIRLFIALSTHGNVVAALLLAGFGIKAGAVLVHFWLPLAHPAAPVPASAVLSGAMIKAGLLGWLRFLPPEHSIGLGMFLVAMGFVSAFYSIAVGLTQEDPKTILAYSSVSQMGIMTAGLGVAFTGPETWAAGLYAVTTYALHHAFSKGALFLGVGVMGHADQRLRRLVTAGMILPSLSLAAAPFTSGAAAKAAFKSAAVFAPYGISYWSNWLLPASSIATALLMSRFLIRLQSVSGTSGEHRAPHGLLYSWLVLLGCVAFAGLATSSGAHEIFFSLWPIILAVAIVMVVRKDGKWRAPGLGFRMPPGDLVVILDAALRRLDAIRKIIAPAASIKIRALHASVSRGLHSASSVFEVLPRAEGSLGRMLVAGTILIFLAIVLLGLALF